MAIYTQKPTLPVSIKKAALQFTALHTIDDFAALAAEESYKLELLAANPEYKIYEIPKKDGSFRLIEDPEPVLKGVLRSLNHYMQCQYYTVRPACVYGFCISDRFEDDRNIVNNARRHIGQKYMLNLDMEDFFHTISTKRVYKLFDTGFTNFNNDLVGLLATLTTFKGRLPMGSPASPVISNFVTFDLDAELANIANGCGLIYTRFADDLTFSASEIIDDETVSLIRDAIVTYGYIINENKVKMHDEAEEKTVTGLIVKDDSVVLPENYVPQVSIEIERLKNVMQVELRYRTGINYRKLKLLKQELLGKISFAEMVLGEKNEGLIKLMEQYEDAINPDSVFESASWLEIPYFF